MSQRSKELLTSQRIEQYQGKKALLDTWEAQSDDIQYRNHKYLLGLRAKLRLVRNYVIHRSDPEAKV